MYSVDATVASKYRVFSLTCKAHLAHARFYQTATDGCPDSNEKLGNADRQNENFDCRVEAISPHPIAVRGVTVAVAKDNNST